MSLLLESDEVVTMLNRHKRYYAVLALSRLGLQMPVALRKNRITTIMQHLLPHIQLLQLHKPMK